MLEDLFYELLPVVGFAVLASSILVCIVMRRVKGAFRFVLFLAMADILLGVTLTISGFHGVMVTIYGDAGEKIKPLNCATSKAIHLSMEIISDALHCLLLLWFTADRLLQMILPVQYSKISFIYTHWFCFFIVICLSFAVVIPSFQYPIKHRHNATMLISPMCRFEEVFGEDYFTEHIWAVQWTPLIGLGILAASLIVFGIRNTKQRWTYNWSEKSGDTVQLTIICIIRCLLTAVAIHLPLLAIANLPNDTELTLLSDVLIRVAFSLFIPVLQPVYYLFTMPVFTHNARIIFNKYSHNTKRTWQSATDPPLSNEHIDPHGDRNPFGSWYSMTGNVMGEAGLPTEERAGIERSISFYYREDGPVEKEKKY